MIELGLHLQEIFAQLFHIFNYVSLLLQELWVADIVKLSGTIEKIS